VLKRLTDDYKFNSEREIAGVLAELLNRTLPDLPKDTVVVPVATASAHVRQYGFDHAYLLAKKFAQKRRLKCQKLLIRTNNQTQHFLKRAEREKAVKNAFQIRRNAQIPIRVLIIDDVMTTGATLRAVRALLKRNGVKKITIATICTSRKNDI